MKRLSLISFLLILSFALIGQNWGDADVAYLIYDLDSSRVVAESHADVRMTPASIMKLVTTASVLEFMGPEYRITTPVTTDGTIDSAGVLNGNIYVRGTIDPTVESAYLSDVAFFGPLISALRDKGIKSVNGDIVVDGSAVTGQETSDKWVLEDLATYYGAGCFGIALYDNVRTIRIKSHGAGKPVTFSFTYPDCQPAVIDHVDVGAGSTTDIHLYSIPYGTEVLVRGTMKPNSTWSDPIAITDPARFFANHLRRRLLDEGIAVTGVPRVGTAQGDSLLYPHLSPILFNICRVTNYRSNNLYAQHLFRLIGFKIYGNTATTSLSARAIVNLWRDRGIDLSSVAMYDGNGLSPFDAVTSRQLVDLLNYMWRSDNGYFFLNTLPLCGHEGTVRRLFSDSPLYVRAKSGSFTGVQSYAGYIVSCGHCYSFTIIVNRFSVTRNQVRSMIEHTITKAISEYENTL